MAVFRSSLLLVAVVASYVAGSVDIANYQNDITSDYSPFADSGFFSDTSDISLGSTSLSVPGNEASGMIVGSFSSPASIIHAQATAEAIAETAAAKTARANAAAQAKMNTLRISAAQLNAEKKQSEAEVRTQAAAVHFAKANAASERKMRAETEESNELASAKKEQEIAERLRQAAAQIMSAAQEESKSIQANIARLQREAIKHDARAEAARTRAEAAKASMDAAMVSSTGLQTVGASGASSSFSPFGGLDYVSPPLGGLYRSSNYGGMSDTSSALAGSSDSCDFDETTASSRSISYSDSAAYTG